MRLWKAASLDDHQYISLLVALYLFFGFSYERGSNNCGLWTQLVVLRV
jgi:hypothetical protein